jgi:hypothetical protein
MNITSGSFGGRNVVFDSVLEDIPGGVALGKSRVKTGTVEIPAGAPVYVNKSTRVAELVKTATVLTGGTSTAVRVPITHQFKAGEYVTDGVAVQTISTITAGTTYDTLNLGGALISYGAGVVISEVNSGASMVPYASATIVTGSGKTMTILDPSGKLAGVNVSITANGSDALAVTFANNTLSIALASTTAGSNTPGVEIQAAIRALTTAGYGFLNIQCSGDEIAGSALAPAPATGTIAMNQPYAYLPNGFVKDTVNVEGANVDCSVVVRGAVRESALPSPLTTALKANLSQINFNA